MIATAILAAHYTAWHTRSEGAEIERSSES